MTDRKHLTDTQALIEDLRLNHEYCPKEVILRAADYLDALSHSERLAKLRWQYFECPACGSEGARAFPKVWPLTDEQAHQTLLDMAKHIETFGDDGTSDQQLSAECVRFILDRVASHSIN